MLRPPLRSLARSPSSRSAPVRSKQQSISLKLAGASAQQDASRLKRPNQQHVVRQPRPARHKVNSTRDSSGGGDAEGEHQPSNVLGLFQKVVKVPQVPALQENDGFAALKHCTNTLQRGGQVGTPRAHFATLTVPPSV